MKVAIVSCVYPPEPVVSARTSADLAEALAAAGDEVTVICPFPSRPAGAVHPGYRRRWSEAARVGGVDLLRRFATLSRRSTLLSRLAENVSFGISSAIALARLPRPDVLYMNTWPLFATSFCALVAGWRRIPFVVWVQDVYPESLLVQDRMSAAGFPARVLRALDGWIARRAAALIVLTSRWASVYRETRAVDPQRVHVVPNWIDETAIRPEPARAREWRRAIGVGDDEFLLVYGGNVGAAAAVEELIDCFARLDPAGAKLLVAGEGACVARCEEIAAQIAPGRVLFHRPWKEEETSAVLGAADVLVLPTRGRQSSVSVPSKLISYMLASRPVIALADAGSETGWIVSASEAGWVVAPGDCAALGRALEAARALPEGERERIGASARAWAVEHFGRAALERAVAIVRGAA